jgi:hypothetical protein
VLSYILLLPTTALEHLTPLPSTLAITARPPGSPQARHGEDEANRAQNSSVLSISRFTPWRPPTDAEGLAHHHSKISLFIPYMHRLTYAKPKPNPTTLAATAKTTVHALIKQLKAAEHNILDLEIAHAVEISGLQRELCDAEAGWTEAFAEQEEEIRAEIYEEKDDEIYDLTYSLRGAIADTKRLEQELEARDEEVERMWQTRLRTLERSLAQERVKNTELAGVKEQLAKVQKRWAKVAEFFLGEGEDDIEVIRKDNKNQEDESTLIGSQ